MNATGKAKKGTNATAKGTVMTEPQQAYGRFDLHARVSRKIEHYGKRSFQSQEGGGVWGGGIWKFKLRQSCGNPPFFLHQSTPNVPIRRNVKTKQAPKLKFLK